MRTMTVVHRRTSPLLACAALTLVLASACGDSGDSGGTAAQPSKTEQWAGQVCSIGTSWLGAISSAEATLSNTNNLNGDAVRGAVDDIVNATETMVTDLGKVGSPETTAGDQAQAQLTSLSDELQKQQDVISGATEKSAGSPQEMLTQISTVTGAVSAMLTDISTTIEDIRQLDGAAELEKAFQDASACQELRASAKPSA